jgi:group I intron endonuclease
MSIGIYKITSPTNKIYIGQSINIEKTWKYRYKNIEGCKKQPKVYRSLKKYGYDTHKFEIIEECSEDKLLERETYWKNYYKVLDIPSLCCRIDGRSGRLSEETKSKLSKALKGKGGKYIRTEKLRNEISERIKVKIYQFDKDGEFIKEWNSILEAENFYGKGIKSVLANKTNISRNFIWSYDSKITLNLSRHKNERRVNQLNLNDEFIKTWNSLTEVEKTLGFPNSNISSCCLKKQKTAYGFKWEYEENSTTNI